MSSARVKARLEAVAATKTVAPNATEAATAGSLLRLVANDTEATMDTRAAASALADELGRIPDTGQAQRRAELVGKAATFAQQAAPTA